MRKLFYILSTFVACVVLFSSCDVTRMPEGNPVQKPFERVSDAKQNRDAVYALLIGVENPDALNAADIMSDLYHITRFDNNTLPGIFSWNEAAVLDNSLINNYYGKYYRLIVQVNYFIARTQELIDSKTYTTTNEEKALLKQYIGELKTIRALAHWRLVQRFSKPWDGKTDNEEQSGIIVSMVRHIDEYDPLATAKKAKATRAKVYEKILQDLNEAIASISESANTDVKPAIYVTRDYAYAVKARVCLSMHDYDGAVEAVDAFIDKYPIADNGDGKTKERALASIWVEENSPEILVRLHATPQFGSVSSRFLMGGSDVFLNKNGVEWISLIRPTLVPEKWVLDLYREGDLRAEYYVGKMKFSQNITGPEFRPVTKFKGNPALNQKKEEHLYAFGVHLFSIAEAYLIKSEALLENGDLAGSLKTLMKLEKSRMKENFPDEASFGTTEELRKEIEDERVRELIGEGFRLNDLVRWGRGFERGEPQTIDNTDGKESIRLSIALKLKIEKDNKMFIWEFPLRDRENNPNLAKYRNWR